MVESTTTGVDEARILLFYPLNLQQLFLEKTRRVAITVSPLAAFFLVTHT
jgi:hypothetical protein